MLKLVDNPIAFNPTAELYEQAVKNKWKIVIERKNMMYTLEPNDDNYRLTQATPH